MNPVYLFQTAAYVPVLAVRPFLTAFFIALLARFGIPLPADYQAQLGPWATYLLGDVPTTPDWFIHPITLAVFGVLAFVELFTSRSSDIRAFFSEFDGLVKAAVTLLVVFALVDSESGALVNTVINQVASGSGTPAVSFASTIFSAVWSVITAVSAWLVAALHNSLMLILSTIDENDYLGLQGWLSWLEDLGVLGGVILATLVPLIAIIVFALTLLGLLIARIYVEHRERQLYIPCGNCQQPIHPSATMCYHCQQPLAEPHRIGVFGQPLDKLAADPDRHRFDLITRKRCPTCATRLHRRALRQACPTCTTVTFTGLAQFDAYLATVGRNLPLVLAISFVLGFIPFLGIIPAVIFYRIYLISSLQAYLPASMGCTTRWGVRLLNIGLVALQPIPLLGPFVLPLMVVTNYYVYRYMLRSTALRRFGRPLGTAQHVFTADSPTPDPAIVADLFQAALTAREAGDRDHAEELLTDVVQADPTHEAGWLHLADLTPDPSYQRQLLERVLALNPHNDTARQRLEAMTPVSEANRG